MEDIQLPQLSAQQAQAILQFLSRTQINGAEAPAFMECVMVLRMIASPPQQTQAAPVQETETPL
jgi:hypothetical protein